MNLFFIDLYISQFIQKLNNLFLKDFLWYISYIGNVAPLFSILFLCLVYFYFTKHRKAAFFLITSATVGVGISTLLKRIIARPRPSPTLVDVAVKHSDFSFPSTHCVSFTIIFGFLYYYLTIHHKKNPLNKLTRFILLFVIVSVGVSRIYLGAHWFSDVLGGYILGLLVLFLSIKLFKK